MPDEVTVRKDGTAEAAFALTPAWHGLGVVLDHPMTSGEALTSAQLDWLVEQRPVFLEVVHKGEVNGLPVEKKGYRRVPDLLANLRADNDFVLGTVSEAYKVVQNIEAFQFLDGLVDDHRMEYESAFSLRGGKQVVLLGRLPQVDTIAPGDATLRYVLMSLHHDGGGAIRFGPTSVRVVCMNTYRMAVEEGHTKELVIRHTGKIAEKLNDAKRILGLATERFDQHAEASRKLAAYRMSGEDWDAFLDVMCPRLDPRDPDFTEKRAERIGTTRKAVSLAYLNERQSIGGIGATAWAAFNAVSEHIEHLPRRGATQRAKAEARFNVCLYGAGRDMKQRAFETACRFAGLTVAETLAV